MALNGSIHTGILYSNAQAESCGAHQIFIPLQGVSGLSDMAAPERSFAVPGKSPVNSTKGRITLRLLVVASIHGPPIPRASGQGSSK